MSREAEKKYADNLTEPERQWLAGKPFPAGADGALYRADATAQREGLEELANFCRLLLAIAPQPGERLLDLGGGSGWVARLALRFGLCPTLIDLAPAMCRTARVASPVTTVPFPIIAGAAESLPCADGVFAVCLINGALHHCADPVQVLREVRRVLASGGRMALCEPGEDHAISAAAQAAAARHGVTERGLKAENVLQWLTQAGFSSARVLPQLADDFALEANGLASLRKLDKLPAGERLARDGAGLLTGQRGAVLDLGTTIITNLNSRLRAQVCAVAVS